MSEQKRSHFTPEAAPGERSQQELLSLLNNLPGVVYRCRNDPQWTMEFITPRIEELTGYTPEDLLHNKRLAYAELILEEDRSRVWQSVQQGLAAKRHFRVEYRIRTSHGEEKWIWEQGTGVFAEDGSLRFIEGFLFDVTEHKRTEQALRDSEEKYRTILEHVAEGYFEIDLAGNFTFFNETVCEAFGYSREELLGMNNREFASAEAAKKMYNDFASIYETGRPLRLRDYEIITKDGTSKMVEVSAHLRWDDQGNPIGFRGVARDITEHRMAEQALHRMAYYDKLTGLPNRELFKELFRQAKARSQRHGNKMAVFFVDMDGLKSINDTLGHTAGDELIRKVGQRLEDAVREEDTIARFSGDEFICLTEKLESKEAARAVGERIRQAITAPCSIGESLINPQASIGYSIYPDDAEDMETMLQLADIAMYQAKKSVGHKVQAFIKQMKHSAADKLRIEEEIRQGLRKEEFVVLYQPQVELSSRRIIGFEALLRWEHPRQGLLPPSSFLPFLEESGLIKNVGEWVIDSVCRQNKEWQEKGFPPVYVAINLSSRQCHNDDLLERIRQALLQSNLEPHFLGFEFTENLVLEHAATLSGIMRSLANWESPLLIDNFGAEYTSLSSLRRFPLDVVKLDITSIQEVPGNRETEKLVSSLVDIAHVMDKKVLAAGVERKEQMEFLQSCGCDLAQGFYIADPLPAEEVERIWRA